MEMQDVASGGWLKLVETGDKAEWVFQKYFMKEAREQYGEQIVAVLIDAGGVEQNVSFPASNTRYLNQVKGLKPGHKVIVTLEWFWNKDKGELVNESGKTKWGMSFAKNYSIKQSTLPDTTFVNVAAGVAEELF